MVSIMTCELQGPQLFTGSDNHDDGASIRNINELHFEVIFFNKKPDHINMHINSFQLGKFGSSRKSQTDNAPKDCAQ